MVELQAAHKNPGRVKLVAKKPLLYWQELDELRRYFVDLVNLKLMSVCRVRGATMEWTTGVSGTPNVTFTYHVILRGWPEEVIPFGVMPAHMRKMRELALLVRRFERGLTYFVKATDQQLRALVKKEGLTISRVDGSISNTARMDTGSRRLRPVETRSKRLRKCDVKTSRLVNGQED